MFKVLVTGAAGQVGSELKALSLAYKQFQFTFVDRTQMDMGSEQAISEYFKSKNFDTIINCAAYTAVDKAESEIALAEMINHRAVATLARIACEKKMKLIHISTDYVFDGKSNRPYLENDSTNPINVYGKSKRAGEEAILLHSPLNSIIIRTSWVYSSFGHNFVKTMLRLGRERDSLNVVFDQLGTPTYARDLARTILEILPNVKNSTPAIYHYTNEGVTSWYDFSKKIFELSKISCVVTPIPSSGYLTPAIRPQYGVLDKAKIKNEFGVSIADWEDSLLECLRCIL